MAGEEFVSKDEYRVRVQQEHKALLIQVAVLLMFSIGIAAGFYVTLTPHGIPTPAAE